MKEACLKVARDGKREIACFLTSIHILLHYTFLEDEEPVLYHRRYK